MNNQRPKVSVIIPVYNGKEHIGACLESVLAQTLREIEIICIDDGSNDGTPEILKQYREKDQRISILTQSNGGAGKARNAGLAVAQGETLSFLDADDFFELNMLEKAYQKLKETGAQFVAFDSDVYLNDSGEYKKPRHLRKEAFPPYEPFHRRSLTDNPFRVFIGWAWDKLYDAAFVKEHGLLFQEQRTTNDMAFVFSALAVAEKIAVVDLILAHHRKNVETSLSNTREASWHCFHDALIRVREYLVSQGIYYELEQDFINYALHACLWNLESLHGESQKKMYNRLREEWLEEFGLNGKSEAYFDYSADYQKLLRIQSFDYDQYFHT